MNVIGTSLGMAAIYVFCQQRMAAKLLDGEFLGRNLSIYGELFDMRKDRLDVGAISYV